MKHLICATALFMSVYVQAQFSVETIPSQTIDFSISDLVVDPPPSLDIKLEPKKWKLTKNHVITGALVFTAGMAKGFNETLQFHWKEFRRQYPKANAKWYNPAISWKNKYANNDPNAGPKFTMSTSLLVMVTDQYHLNNFINRMAWGSAMVIKLGEKKKPIKQYLLDMLYYLACHQAGFALTYYPFSKFKGK